MRQKSFRQERHLDLNSGVRVRGAVYYRLGSYIETVERLQWEVYNQPLEGFYAPYVHEFYANLPESRDDRCWVRGRWVDYSQATINHYYAFEDRDDEEEDGGLLEDHAILDVLTAGHGDTDQRDSGTIKMTYFTREARTWRLFIAHNLHPVSQEHEVRRESYRLLFRIIVGQYINVGRIIHERLAHWHPTQRQKLGFPHLIMTLCSYAGLRAPQGEPLVQPLQRFDGNYIFHRIKVHESVETRSSYRHYLARQAGQLGPVEVPPEPQPAPGPRHGESMGSPPRPRQQGRSEPSAADHTSITELMQMVRVGFERQERRQERLARRQAELGQWMHQTWVQLGHPISMPPILTPLSDEEEDAGMEELDDGDGTDADAGLLD